MSNYWHEISQDEIDTLIENKATNQFVVDNYKQPDWCSYPEALAGRMGCYSLLDRELRTKISPEFCKGCDCCNLNHNI